MVADNGEKGLTFAVEPIKLALSGHSAGRINDKKQSLSRENSYTGFTDHAARYRVAIFLIRLFSVRIEMRHPLVMGNWKLNGSPTW